MEPRPREVQTSNGSTRQEHCDDQVSRVFRTGGVTTLHGVHVQPRQKISGGGKNPICINIKHQIHIDILNNTNKIIYCTVFFILCKTIFVAKKIISTPLMMENPVRSPMVPPIADNMSTNFAALSLVILSNVGVSK